MENRIKSLYQEYKKSSGVGIDTRNIQTDNIFFALKGDNFNGNRFAQQAVESGARFAVIDEPEFQIKGKTILVENVLSALQDLAKYHRNKLDIPVIGLTGSNGKTTTKELIKIVLSKKFQTFATAGNLNNHIGVPLSILAITDDFEMAIIEMGANHVGEISFLCGLVRPNYGLITNIGKAHIGEFGNYEAIIRAKSELYHFLIKNKGQVFINSSQEILMNMSKRFENPVFYPNEGDYYHCEYLGSSPFVKFKTESGSIAETQLIGRYNFDNIATALCLGKYFEVPENKALEAISEYFPSNNRSQVIKKGAKTIILDAYNANPSSMEAALFNLSQMKGEQKIVILGDMYELGKDSEQEHKNIGIQLNKYGFAKSLLCGTNMKQALKVYPAASHFEKREDLVEYLKLNKFENGLILVKGSRGMGLEKILDYL